MARVLIVGCGCRGRALARELLGAGHAVRGTTRDPARAAEIEAAGAEAVVADPDRLGTLLPHLEGVSALCWLMGSAEGPPEAVAALHGDRLESIARKLVDTPVRGIAYEAAGTLPPAMLGAGATLVRMSGATFGMPNEVVEADPADLDAWLAAMRAAVDRVLAG